MAIIRCQNVHYRYPDSTFTLDISDFTVLPGETVFVQGASGSGKTSLINLIVGLIRARSGDITICGQSLSELSERAMDRFRADHFGVIFQMFNLVSYLSVRDNILLPCAFSRRRYQQVLTENGSLDDAVSALCLALDLGDDILSRPVGFLSVGQQQRVAIARAIMGKPEIIVADEPTSSLDPDRTQKFLDLLIAQCERHHTTLLFVSHDHHLAHRFDRTIQLEDINQIQPGGSVCP